MWVVRPGPAGRCRRSPGRDGRRRNRVVVQEGCRGPRFAVGDGNVLTFSNQFSHELLIVVPYVELTEWSGRVESRRILFSFDVGGPLNCKFGRYKSMVSSSQFALVL